MKKFTIFMSLILLTSCGGGKGKGPEGSAGSGNSGSNVTITLGGESDTPVAEINGQAITEKELNEKI
jgi:hypothetical protein